MDTFLNAEQFADAVKEGYVGFKENPSIREVNSETLQDVLEEVELLRTEQLWMTMFMDRVAPRVAAQLEALQNKPTTSQSSTSKQSRGSRRASSSQSNAKQDPTPTNIPEELDLNDNVQMIYSVIQDCNNEINTEKAAGDARVTDLQVLKENLDLQHSDVCSQLLDIKRLHSYAGLDGRPTAPMLIKWLEERIRKVESSISKQSARGNQLKQSIAKTEQESAHREQMGETLHFVDFDQLKIENQQALEKIEERNNELLKLKITTGKIVQTLNTAKKKLQGCVSESQSLHKMIKDRHNNIAFIETEYAQIEKEMAMINKGLGKMQAAIEASAMPEILEYVKQKMEFESLTKSVKSREKKIQIKTMELKHRRQMASTII